MSFDRRPLAPGDAREWAALLTAIEDADGGDDYSSEQDLQEAFGNPSQDYGNGSIVRLYEQVGFTVALTWIAYRKQLT